MYEVHVIAQIYNQEEFIMSDFVTKWTNVERDTYPSLTVALTKRIQEGILRAISEKTRRNLADGDYSEVTVPWGTYKTEIKVKGETTNITPTWEPSKGFMKYLNGDINDAAVQESLVQGELDVDLLQLMINWIAYGIFDIDAPEYRDTLATREKFVLFSTFEMEYWLNSMGHMIANIGREQQHDGMIYSLEMLHPFEHGTFRFEYEDDEIKVTWAAGKVFKQALKNDSAADLINNTDFSRIEEPRITVEPVKEEKDEEPKKKPGRKKAEKD